MAFFRQILSIDISCNLIVQDCILACKLKLSVLNWGRNTFISSFIWNGSGQSIQKTAPTPHPMTPQKEKEQPPKTVYMERTNTFFPDLSS